MEMGTETSHSGHEPGHHHDPVPYDQDAEDVWVIDVSRWQGVIDWQAVKNAGVQGAWIKAGGSDGGFYKDSMSRGNLDGAETVGLVHGTYYFAVPREATTEDARAQAEHAVSVDHGRGQMWPALDLESNPNGLSDAQLDDWAMAFCGRVAELTGRDSVIYTGAYFGLGRTRAGWPTCPLWVANYGQNVPSTEPPTWDPAVPLAWGEDGWSAWQFNSVTSVPGIVGNVDQNTVKAGFWAEMLGENEGEEDMALTGVVRTKVGSAWALEHIGVNNIPAYFLTIEGSRKVRHLTPESLNVELFWTGGTIENVWEVDDNFFTGGRYVFEHG